MECCSVRRLSNLYSNDVWAVTCDVPYVALGLKGDIVILQLTNDQIRDTALFSLRECNKRLCQSADIIPDKLVDNKFETIGLHKDFLYFFDDTSFVCVWNWKTKQSMFRFGEQCFQKFYFDDSFAYFSDNCDGHVTIYRHSLTELDDRYDNTEIELNNNSSESANWASLGFHIYCNRNLESLVEWKHKDNITACYYDSQRMIFYIAGSTECSNHPYLKSTNVQTGQTTIAYNATKGKVDTMCIFEDFLVITDYGGRLWFYNADTFEPLPSPKTYGSVRDRNGEAAEQV